MDEEAHDPMEVEFQEEESHLGNDETLTKNAIQLQKKLDELKRKIVTTKAELRAKNQGLLGAAENNDDQLYGKQDVSEDNLHQLTVQRTQTFLNFKSLQTAIRAAQSNQALTRALNMERESNIALEEEEEQYVRDLLEEQRVLAEQIIENQNKVVDQELRLIDARSRLAEEHSRYQELFEKVRPTRLSAGHDKDEGVRKLNEQLQQEEDKLNQMRFMIQKFMISHPKLGLQFDRETNEKYKKVFLTCGCYPEEIRAQFCEGDSGYNSNAS